MNDLISRDLLIRRLGAWDKGANAIPNYAWKVIRELESVSICKDAISRQDAIRIASGYCHWSNIPKELEKLPSVNPKPCGDAISRQAVDKLIDELARAISDERCFTPRGRSTATIMQDILDLPSVSTEKTGLWIPVSEKLPEDGIYLVTVERIAGEPRIETKSFAKNLNRVDNFSFRKHKCGWYDYDSEYGYWEDTNVIAWMPLPPCYEPQESEDEG